MPAQTLRMKEARGGFNAFRVLVKGPIQGSCSTVSQSSLEFKVEALR